MATRPSRSQLRFSQRLVLKPADGAGAPAAHAIESDAASRDGGSRPAQRQAASFIRVQRDGASAVVQLDAEELSQLLHTGVVIPLD